MFMLTTTQRKIHTNALSTNSPPLSAELYPLCKHNTKTRGPLCLFWKMAAILFGALCSWDTKCCYTLQIEPIFWDTLYFSSAFENALLHLPKDLTNLKDWIFGFSIVHKTFWRCHQFLGRASFLPWISLSSSRAWDIGKLWKTQSTWYWTEAERQNDFWTITKFPIFSALSLIKICKFTWLITSVKPIE